MSAPLKFFRDKEHAETTQRFLSERGIKSFIRERSGQQSSPNEEAFGYDLFALKDEDIEEARQLIAFEFGSVWGQ